MDFLRPSNWADCLAAKAAHPDAVPIAGGTDLMVELNFDHRRPPALLDLGPVAELADWSTVAGRRGSGDERGDLRVQSTGIPAGEPRAATGPDSTRQAGLVGLDLQVVPAVTDLGL